mgnify:CR=1 FL=1
MSLEILVPSLPESVSDATLATWHKKPGEFVNKNDNLVDLETDKIVLEVPAPESGILTKIIQQDGAIVVTGDVLALLDTEAVEETASESTDANEAEAEEMPLSPAVRRILQENNIDPHAVHGSGKKGRLTKSDILEYIESHKEQKAAAVQVKPVETPVIKQQAIPQDAPAQNSGSAIVVPIGSAEDELVRQGRQEMMEEGASSLFFPFVGEFLQIVNILNDINSSMEKTTFDNAKTVLTKAQKLLSDTL